MLLAVNRQKASNKKLTHIKSCLDDDDDKLYGGPRRCVTLISVIHWIEFSLRRLNCDTKIEY